MDPVKLYLRDIEKIPLLTPEEEIRLAKRIKRGDTKAKRQMIQSNLRLVISIAKRYAYLGVPMLDLIEEGNIGLMKAVKKYDPRMGYRFSTYAAWWIKQYITRAIANQGKTIRVPVYMVETLARYKKTQDRLANKLGRRPALGEIAKSMKLPVSKIREFDNMLIQPTSLETPIGDEDEGQFIDLVEDHTSEPPTERIVEFLHHEKVLQLLKKMAPREKKILELRFGLKDYKRHTLDEVAKKFKVTRERIRQIEESTLKKLHELLVTEMKHAEFK